MSDSDSRLETETHIDGISAPSNEHMLLPGLTTIYHPKLSRVGERAVLTELGSGRPVEVSRKVPLFLQPGTPPALPLGGARLSRSPILLRPGRGRPGRGRPGRGRPGRETRSVVIDPNGSRMTVEIGGERIEAPKEVSATDIEHGVPILLGSSVLLLLHWMDPLITPVPEGSAMIGSGLEMSKLRRQIRQVADVPVSVLIRGETGSGKELVAQELHRSGSRSNGPFVAVDISTLTPSLAAAELFGAERGAFTGADRALKGLFREADGGTLFLDEIGEAPAEVQSMLRVLETGEIRPVGGSGSHAVDVRVIAATDTDLDAAVADHAFSAPLLHRLSRLVINLAPLRRRREDFGLLFTHFLRHELEAVGDSDRLTINPPWVPAPWIARLLMSSWPGNIRQLRNVVSQLVIENRGQEQITELGALTLVSPAPENTEAPTTSSTGSTRQQASEPSAARRPG